MMVFYPSSRDGESTAAESMEKKERERKNGKERAEKK